METTKLSPELAQYLETACWSSNDPHTEESLEAYDCSETFIEEARKDLASFIEQAGSLLDSLDITDVAHDFWLTRNHHGAGFWDGDYSKEVGDKLTALSDKFGEVNLFLNDDQLVESL